MKSQTHSNHGQVFSPCLASFHVPNTLLLGFLPLGELSPSVSVIAVLSVGFWSSWLPSPAHPHTPAFNLSAYSCLIKKTPENPAGDFSLSPCICCEGIEGGDT